MLANNRILYLHLTGKYLSNNASRTLVCIKKADLSSKRSAKIYTLVYITKKNAKKL